MSRLPFIFILCICLTSTLFAAGSTYRVHFHLNAPDPSTFQDSVRFENTVLKFYVGNFRFFQSDKLLLSDKRYYLIDKDDTTSQLITFGSTDGTPCDRIEFDLGIDSLTQTSGALEGALDPTYGMYWTWQSGYINFKIEGTVQHPERKPQTVEWHIGGYQFPDDTRQLIRLSYTPTSAFEVCIDPATMVMDADPTSYQVMSPGAQAQRLARAFANRFTPCQR